MAGDGLDHYVDVPRYMFIVRIVQAILAVLLLALVCFPTHVWTTSITNAPDALSFNIFTTVWTFIVLAYAIAIPLKSPKYWNKWVSLGLEFITWVFWLTAFAIMADFVRKSSGFGKINYASTIPGPTLFRRQSFDDIDVDSLMDQFKDSYSESGSVSSGSDRGRTVFKSGVTPWWALCAVSTAIGAVGWVLWTFTLYTFSVALKNQHSGTEPVATTEGGEKYGKTGDVEMNTQSVGPPSQ